jgi:predicted methyltransferase
MTILEFAGTASSIRSGIVTIQLNDDLWRVTRPDGEVLGYVHRWQSGSGSRYQAKRMLQRQRRFLPLGDFWSIEDALDIFRF